jgi:hypothetical protein
MFHHELLQLQFSGQGLARLRYDQLHMENLEAVPT